MSVLEDLEQLQQRIVRRASELRSAVDEYAELQVAATKLGIDLDAAPSATHDKQTSPRRAASQRSATKPGAKAAAKHSSATVKRAPGGNRQRGSRRDDVLRLVKQKPGITVPELGKALKVNSTGLYRVVRELENAGQVKKDGRALKPTVS